MCGLTFLRHYYAVGHRINVVCSQEFYKQTEQVVVSIIVAGNYPAFFGTQINPYQVHLTLHSTFSHHRHPPASRPNRWTLCSVPWPRIPSRQRFPAKNTKSTETADTTTHQVVGKLTNKRSAVITGAGTYDFSRKLTSRGFVLYFDSCNQNVQGDASSCPFTTNTFRPERDSATEQTKLICVVCILPVNRDICTGKKAGGEPTGRRGTAVSSVFKK